MIEDRQDARLEDELRAALARYRAILASTLDPVITIDGSGVIQAASDSVQRVFGWSPQELVGRSVNVIMPEPHASRHDVYLAEYRETGQTNILGRTREFDARRRDGSTFPIELSVSRADIPGSDEPLFTGIVRDITERKEAETRLRLIQSLTLSIAQAGDLASAMSTALEQICAATGWDYGEAWVPGPDGERLVATPVWHATDTHLAVFQSLRQETSFAKGDGLPGRVWASREPEWVENFEREGGSLRAGAAAHAGLKAGVAVPILSGPEVVAVIAFFMTEPNEEDRGLLDLVTAAVAPLGAVIERKKAEDELRRHRGHLADLVTERTRALDASHRQLRQADRLASIGTLAAGLGHDMNNVLLPIRSRLDVLEAADLSPDVARQVDSIRKSVQYLQDLTDSLRLLALDPADGEASTQVTHLGSWWEHVSPLLGRSLPQRVRLAMSLPGHLPPVAVAPHRLTQAMLNLLINAGEAVGDEGKVRISAESIDEDRLVRIAVADNGCGMTPEVRQRAMDPFFTTKTRGLGTGLGLSLVRGIAHAAGGACEIDSEPGRGTTITLTLPAQPAETADREAAAAAGREAVVSLEDRRIGSLLAGLLASLGFETQYDDSGNPGTSALWVTMPSPAALERARAHLLAPGRAVIVIGPAPAEWQQAGAIVVSDPEDFGAVREQVHQAAGRLAESGES